MCEWAPSQFSLTVYESTGAVGADEFIRHMWKEFRWLLLRGQRLSFVCGLGVTRGCLGLRIHSLQVKAVLGGITEWERVSFP
jgi:hypothetical protein